jgi:ATP-dependent HslUV protease ATP-binding subunit HslU
LTKQYAELLGTEGVTVEFTRDGVEKLAETAFEVNRTTQNIGARRLHTILERVVDEVSYEAPEFPEKRVVINAGYVDSRLSGILKSEDLSKFIL